MRVQLYTIIVLLCMTFNTAHAATTSTTSTNYDPTAEGKTNIHGSYWFVPSVSPVAEGASEKLAPFFTFGIGIEGPLYWFLTGGVIADVGFGISQDGAKGTARLINLDGVIKPQYPLTTRIGHFSFYASIPVGISVGTGYPFFDRTEAISPSTRHGVGFNFGGFGGIEYFPIPQIGIFAEGGYRLILLSYRNVISADELSWNFSWYRIQAPGINFGIRITL